ncbi:beta-1,3-galactosyltransferase brn [Anopheles stephensi]|uniref:Hexosyltransferase n=1 Tax=Anopheles stephensi TaxID=30069 RepID=A0A182Y2R3_ANOST|nr:beta-1,3-galactosyltransferase brn [Anopheles stephensi]XP_035907800.1 beta-1,3-galactosyltransferase brn [Anopheles stephensi]XP_035907801.1 beta-1,3-galactosyltransferase brn [Anopheles stephensi]XP_035907802.1 beta-1,3-galactosyltransferase brn [Anopheles stephensi]
MFERRPVLGVLGCLTLVLTIWQISPRDVTVYREATSPYLPSGQLSLTASASISSGKQIDQQKLPYDSDENNAIDDRKSVNDALPPPFGYSSNREFSNGGTSGTYLVNQTSPGWLVAAAAAAVAASPTGIRTVTPGRYRWNGNARVRGREDGREADLVSHKAPTSSSSSSISSSTQSTASLTVASAWGDSLPNDDYTSLIDLKDFKFTINYDYCGTGTGGSRQRRSLKRADALRGTRSPATASPPLVLVLIHSAPANLAKRNTIRATWGEPDERARLIFLMGAVSSNASQRAIERESRLYDDIVQGNFVDAYRNMTYKHVMALKWFVYHCPGAHYVLKTDDDVFINTPVLYNALGRVVPQRNLLLCQLVTKLSVKRTHRSKWFVSWREYPSRYYPPHCPGYSILYSPDVAWQLYREAQRQPFFWIDDVHITGTVAQQVNVTITPMDGLYLDSEAKSDLLENRVDASHAVFFFTNPNLSMDEIQRLWETVRPGR